MKRMPVNLVGQQITYRRAACVIFLIASACWGAVGRDERSGWILMTSPAGADHSSNSLLGYCYLYQGKPFMKENIPHAGQIGLFCGSRDALNLSEYRQDFRHLRAIYSLLASLIASLVGIIPAMLILNWLAWAACAWITWRLTFELFRSELSAFLSVLLVCSGMGMTTHIGDYSPHLLAFATYFFGIWLLVHSRVYRESRTWRTHLVIGLSFAIAALTYNTGVMLVGVYLLTAARRNHPLQLAAVAILGLSARPLLQLLFGSHIFDVEADYFHKALPLWRALFRQDAIYIIKTLGHWLSEFLFFFDSPLVVIAGLACCVLTRLPLSLRWLGCCAIGVPIAAALVFTPIANARGYLVYGGAIWLYACLAGELTRALSSKRLPIRWITSVAFALLLMTHVAWSASHLVGFLLPVKTYFVGWDDGAAYYPPARILSLTGAEPTPVLFGGHATLRDAGALVTNQQHELTRRQVSFPLALGAKAWFAGYFLLLALVAANQLRAKLTWAAAVLVILISSSVLSVWLFRNSPAFFKVDEAVPLKPLQTLRYDLELGDDFRNALRQAKAEGSLVFFLRGSAEDHSGLDVQIHTNGEPIPVEYHEIGKFVVPDAAFEDVLTKLFQQRSVRVEIRNRSEREYRLFGWQRSGLAGRKCVYMTDDQVERQATAVLPVFEVRLVRPNGSIQLAGF